ncbi:hypothetical protein B0J14DRAFT_652899 [Halenospora varia]|nr:hypothetical protein B0J14DRAFT_652899 [Halenospora varia]
MEDIRTNDDNHQIQNQNHGVILSIKNPQGPSMRRVECFPDLLLELRIKVWKFVANSGRIIPIQFQEQPSNPTGSDKRIFSPQPYPAMQYVNSEAAEIALEMATPLFDSVPENFMKYEFISMNLDIDTLALAENTSLRQLERMIFGMSKERRMQVTKLIRHSHFYNLTVWLWGWTQYRVAGPSSRHFYSPLQTLTVLYRVFPSLKGLTFVVDPERYPRDPLTVVQSIYPGHGYLRK